MAPDVVINIKTLSDGGRDVQKTVGSFTELNSALSLAGKGLDYLKKAYDATVGSTISYANEVRKLSQVSGQSAEESSRLLQVLDDFKISSEQVTAATRKLTAQGLSPTTETLAQLSDQFLKLNPGTERAAFLMENFGRAGQDFAEVMLQGGDALRQMSSAVDDSLILTEEALRKTRQYELAVDDLSDAWQGATTEIGLKAIPILTNALDAMDGSLVQLANDLGLSGMAAKKFAETIIQMQGSTNSATESYKAWAESVEVGNEALDENTHLLGANTEAMQRAAEGQAAFSSGAAELRGQLLTGKIGLEEYNVAMEELHKETHEKAVPAFDAMNDRADYLMEKFQEAGKDIPKNMSLAGAGVAASAESITNSLKDPVGKITALNEKVEAAYKKSGLEIEYFVNIITRGGLPNLNQLNQAATQNCFVAGTLITMADGSQKPIEDVQVGDKIISHDFFSWQNIETVVTQVFHHPTEQTKFYLLINGKLGVTPNHQLWTPDGWAEAGKLIVGDCLMDIDGYEIEIKTIETVGKSVPTYNLHVDDENHNYHANGFLVHNKAGGGQVFGPGNGMTDGFLVPMANGEYVVRSSVVKKPGVLAFLEMLNSGQLGRGFATGGFIDKGQSGPVINQQQRDRDRDIPGGGVSLGGIPIPTTSTTTDAALTVPSGPGMSSAGGVSGAAGSLMAGNAASNLASIQSVGQLQNVNQNLETLIAVVQSSNANLTRTLASNANKRS